jgi:hypothetical protein
MSRSRLSIAGMMLVVATCGLGFAAIRESTYGWAVAAQTVAWTLVLGAALGACVRHGHARLAWASFALFGLVALPLSVLASRDLDPAFLPGYALDRMVIDHGGTSSNNATRWASQMRICRSLGAIAFAATGAVVGGLVYPTPGRRSISPDESL